MWRERVVGTSSNMRASESKCGLLFLDLMFSIPEDQEKSRRSGFYVFMLVHIVFGIWHMTISV